MKTLKIIGIALIFSTLLFFLYKAVKYYVEKSIALIQYKLSLSGVYLKSLKINELNETGKTALQFEVDVNIKNPTKLSVKLSDVNITIAYKDVIVAESLKYETYKLLPESQFDIKHKMKYYISNEGTLLVLNSILDFAKKEPGETIKYNIAFKIFGIFKQNITDTYQISF